jgi:hypothetical protein
MPATRPAAPSKAVWLRRKLAGGGAPGSGSGICSSGRGVDSSVGLFFRFRARGALGSAVEDVEGVGGRDESVDATDEGGGGILVCGKLSVEASGLEVQWSPRFLL